MPQVSIIIPIYNAERLLGATLDADLGLDAFVEAYQAQSAIKLSCFTWRKRLIVALLKRGHKEAARGMWRAFQFAKI